MSEEADGFVIKRREMPQDRPGSIPGFADGDELPFALYLKDAVANTIRLYVSADAALEVGGVLFGRHYQSEDRQKTVVEVNECLPLLSANRGKAHYTFDASAIRALRSSKQTSTRYLVGWFHSHPGFGDPFMSTDDIELHRVNFPEPWYLSCVVGGGQYSLPLGFFRIEKGQLVNVEEYFIAMTTESALKSSGNSLLVTPVGEASRRFVRAAVGEERPLHNSIELVRRLLTDLGLQVSSTLNTFFESAVERDRAALSYSKALGAFFHFADLARAARHDSEVEDELARLKESLNPVQMFSDAMLLVFATREQGNILAVWGSRCLFAMHGETRVVVGDFELNIFTYVDLNPEDTIQDLTFSETGFGFVLLQNGHLLHVDIAYWDTARKHDRQKHNFLLKNEAIVWDQIEAHGPHLYLRDATRIRHSTRAAEPTKEPTVANEVAVPANTTLLVVDHQADQVGLIYQVDGRVFLRLPYDSSSDLELALPAWAQGRTLTGAALSRIGIALLIGGEQATLLVTFDTNGALRSIVVPEPNDPIKINAVASDEQGRLFVLTESDVWLLAESGTPNESWSASSRRKRNKLWQDRLLSPLSIPDLFGKL